MGTPIRRLPAAGAALVAAVGLAACGGSSNSSSGGGSGSSKGQAVVNAGRFPDSLDPGFGYTTQAAEADWLAYTGLLTYAHRNGQAGNKLIPGLARGLPTISRNGKTYTFMLRAGLTYSNGAPVKARDFAYTVQRALKLRWGGAIFFTDNIVGAKDYAGGKASRISGITADDATGKITVRLRAPYGAFDNVVAFPAAGLVPSGTPMTNQPNTPPPGVGPYTITKVVSNRSYELAQNPRFAGFQIADIPKGALSKIKVQIVPNTQTEAQQVLDNQADAFDSGDTLPPALLSQIQSQASDRFAKEPTVSTYYFFMNNTTKPFNSLEVRQAVNYAIDRNALQRLGSGFYQPLCFFLPAGMPGHPNLPCPYGGRPTAPPDLAKAKRLVQESGLAGTPVTVWGQMRSPRREFVDYYTSVLNSIGLKASERMIADGAYFKTIGNLKLNAQTGFADWNQDFPNPIDFFRLMDSKAIRATKNQNLSQVNDPHIQSELAALRKVSVTQLDSVVPRWQVLDLYAAQQAYQAVYGSELNPKFFGNRLDFGSAVFHPLYGNDFSTWKLK